MSKKLSDLAQKVGKGFEKAVNSIPTDEEIISGLKNGINNLVEGVEKVDSKVAKGLRQAERKLEKNIHGKSDPQNLGEFADDLKGIYNDLKKDLKKSGVKDKLLDFLGAAVDLVKSIGGTPENRKKAFNSFNKSAQKLGEAIGKAFGMAKGRIER